MPSMRHVLDRFGLMKPGALYSPRHTAVMYLYVLGLIVSDRAVRQAQQQQ